MIIFNSISEALGYHKKCPFCDDDLKFKNKDLNIEYNSETRLRFNLSKNDVFYINTINDEVEVSFKQSIFSKINSSYGILYEPIHLECQSVSCGLYAYIIQILVDLKNLKVIKICLNSERISYEENDCLLHEVTNNYIDNTTTYQLHDLNDIKMIKLPIINIDLNNLKHSIERIKKLYVFS